MIRWLPCLSLLVVLVACSHEEPPEFEYYDNRIANVIEVGCVQQTTGCHVANSRKAAVGNLDLTSYDSLLRREDVLYPFGPYSVGQLLLKGGDPIQVPVQTFDAPDPAHPDQRFVVINTDIRHAGGTFLHVGSDGYAELKTWLAQGYRRDGSVQEELSVSKGACTSGAGSHAGFDPSAAPADKSSFDSFVRDVQPVLERRCAGSSCHGSKIADLYLSCGKTEAEQRWNYFAAVSHVDATPALSDILRRPLSKLRGGTFHEGGTVFASTTDEDYVAIRRWAEALVKSAPELVVYEPEDEGLRFFGNFVQPMLVKKGCMFSNCHGPAMFHDLRLRSGSEGVFSRIAIDRNYEMARQQLATSSANPNDSRIIAKNLFPADRGGTVGLTHRGGALFEDFEVPANPSLCEGVDVTLDKLDGLKAYCVLVAWHKLERERALAAKAVDAGPEYPLVWVSRPTGAGDPRDFDTYRPGADLKYGNLTVPADGSAPTLFGAGSLLAGCGLDVASADIRGPAASWDGKHIAFAARSSASEPLRIYEANADGSACAQVQGIAAAKASENGILTHDFDPAYAPDGRLVFASTRGNLQKGYAYSGPTRTPSTLAPNANLYVFDPKAKQVRQLTFLLNQEMQPSFMVDGRLIFTAEKREPEFFQLAGRRMNLDGGDYHPLFAQRDSVGFHMATEIVELSQRNLAFVAAPAGAKDGAGTIAIVNRSIGPDQDDRDPADKLYLHSLTFPLPGAFDKGRGVFRSPVALPSRWMVVSCDPDASNLTVGGFDFDLCVLDPATSTLTQVGGEAGKADVEAVLVMARDQQGVFTSRIDEVNANTRVDPKATDAVVHVHDFPLLSTLLFANTRTGRPIDERVGGFDVLEALPPDASAKSFSELGAKVEQDDFGSVYADYKVLGHVGLYEDGSTKFRIPGGHPILLRLTEKNQKPLTFGKGGPFTGEMTQREQMQFYPGERANQSFQRKLFNGMCGGCHGSVSGEELDVAVDIDVLTSASQTIAAPKPAYSVGL
jgi:hypothetical protein